jgi:Domain of unknown function (DUF5060)
MRLIKFFKAEQKYKSSWSNIGALFLIGCFVGLFESMTPSTLAQVLPSLSASQALQNTRWEATFISTKAYANAFLDITLRVQYTGPNGQRIDGYGFWDGGSAFKIRRLFAIIEADSKSFHTRLICAFDGCVHFVDHMPSAGST